MLTLLIFVRIFHGERVPFVYFLVSTEKIQSPALFFKPLSSCLLSFFLIAPRKLLSKKPLPQESQKIVLNDYPSQTLGKSSLF